MSWHRRLRFLLALAILAGCSGGAKNRSAGLAGRAAGWNVVLLTVDTLRADRLNSNGYEVRATSPRMDELQRSGVRFERAMAPRALTWPSLASVLTGLYPSRHGLVSNGYRFSNELLTLPGLLRENGYQTGAFLSNMCRANHQGWDSFACGGGNDGKVTRQALEWLRSTDRHRPFLLWVHYFGPHPPYYNGGNLAREVLDPKYEGDLAARKGALDRIMKKGIELSPEDRFHLDALYDAAVMGTDNSVGTLLDGVRSAGLEDRTLIVFLADHGEDLYQHNRYLYHACSVYQTTLHVPLAFVAAGPNTEGAWLPGGGEVAQSVELIDVLPTLVELLGLPELPDLDGTSLVPYLERPDRGGRGKAAFSEYDTTRIRTVLDGDWKLIHNPEEITPLCFAGGPEDLYPIAREELYNLAQDPYESRNLAAQNPTKVAELRRRIEEKFSALPGELQRQELPDAVKKELEALGYVAE